MEREPQNGHGASAGEVVSTPPLKKLSTMPEQPHEDRWEAHIRQLREAVAATLPEPGWKFMHSQTM